MDLDILPTNTNNPSQGQNFPFERVLLEESHEWCHISYYEMSNRVGEQYRGTQSQVIIDGYTHPSNAERFCLGGLTNVQRTTEIDRARRYIGRGVKLFHTRGNVFAECLSDNPVFVQSPITNRRFSWHPATVCKIPPSKNFELRKLKNLSFFLFD
jgi:MAD (mothers against decapentaplegic) family protein 2/3